jgi:hypothetical protein
MRSVFSAHAGSTGFRIAAMILLACIAAVQTARARSGSLVASFHGAASVTYLLKSSAISIARRSALPDSNSR